MSASECKREFEVWASDVNWKLLSKCDLMRLLKTSKLANDEEGQVKYLSALMLKYWYKIDLMYKDWKVKGISNLESFDDIVCWVKQGILEALDSYIKFGENRIAPDKIIERCCYQVFVSNCRYYDLDLHKANAYTNSLNKIVKSNSSNRMDDEIEALDILESTSDEEKDYYYSTNCDLVNHFNSNSEFYKAIVIDLLSNYDVLTNKETAKECSIVREIKSMSSDYINRYKYIYNVDITKTVNNMQKSKECDLKELVSYTLESLRNDSYVREALC